MLEEVNSMHHSLLKGPRTLHLLNTLSGSFVELIAPLNGKENIRECIRS